MYRQTKLIKRSSIQCMHHRYNGSCTNHHKDNNNGLYCSDFAQAFIHSISKIMSSYKEDRVIFDRYIENSFKSQTRNKRSGGVEPVRFDQPV